MSSYIDEIVYFCEPFDRWHAWYDLQKLSRYNNGIVRTPERVLAGRWLWSINKVRRYLSILIEQGVLEQVKSGRNNILRFPLSLVEDSQIRSKTEREHSFKAQVLAYTEGEDIQAVEQYLNYWLAYSTTTQLYRFEAKNGFTIEESWQNWLQKRKELQTQNTNNYGRSRSNQEGTRPGSSGECEPITAEDVRK